MLLDTKPACLNPIECKRKREKWEQLQEKFCPVGQKELEAFLENLYVGKGNVRFDKHFYKRSIERSISDFNVSEVLRYGWVIERNKTVKSTSIVVLGYTGKSYRPIHIVFDIISKNLWVAVTAYNPKSHSWKWRESFDSRVCFCNFEEE